MAIQWSAAAINPHLVDAVLTAVYNNRLASDECSIVACQR
jgi:hypothetical protein